jgi:Acetyltransferase (GNAT) domain
MRGGCVVDRFTVRSAKGAAEWEELFAAVDRPHMTRTWAYNEARRATGGVSRVSTNLSVRRLVFERAGSPVAICHVLDKVAAGVCLASRLNRGPLLLGTRPGNEVAQGVYSALRRRWRCLTHGVLLVAPALEAGDDGDRVLRDAGFRPRLKQGWSSAVLDLRLDEAELRANLARTWRNRLKSAERSGLTFSASETRESLTWILSHHVENMSVKDFVGPPAPFVHFFCCASPGDWFVGQVWLPGESEPVAGMLVCQFGNTAEYYVGWFGQAGRKVGAGNFVYWNAVLEARRRGCLRFDLGGYDLTSTFESGLRHFKQGMRGAEYTLVNEWLAL